MPDFFVDTKSSALILIDLQQGIVGRNLSPYSGLEVAKKTAELAKEFRKQKGMVVFLRVNMRELLSLPADAPMRDPKAPLPLASASELVPEAGFQEGDVLITKRQWGAFYGTELDQLLRRQNIKTIVLGGIATNFGVESTARAAFERGYHQIFVKDGMTSMTSEMHEFALKNIFPRMGYVRTTEEILKGLHP